MKTELKKVPRNFRISSNVNDELRRRSEVSGVTETRIVEDALKLYFRTGMEKQMASVLSTFKEVKLPFEMPVTPFISCVC